MDDKFWLALVILACFVVLLMLCVIEPPIAIGIGLVIGLIIVRYLTRR